MAKVPLLLAVDGSRHCGWIQTLGIKNMFLNQRVSLHILLLGCQSFSFIICLIHIRNKVFRSDTGLLLKDLVSLYLLFYHFENKFIIKPRINKV